MPDGVLRLTHRQGHRPRRCARARGPARRIAMVTAYDVAFARLVDDGGRRHAPRRRLARHGGAGPRDDAAGDARRDGLPLRASVSRGVRRAHVVGDMPFMSYQASIEDGMRDAGRLMKEGRRRGGEARGRRRVAELVRRLVARRHPGDGPRRPDAAVGAPDGRLQGAGPQRRRSAPRSSTTRARSSDAGGYAIVLEAIPPSWPRRSPSAVPADHRHRRRPRAATARCWSCTTCSGWSRRGSRAS